MSRGFWSNGLVAAGSAALVGVYCSLTDTWEIKIT